ncbi:hypothetical protein RvY_12914 [Ramazzottius varieornatus]|uniref:Spermatogenesis-associated protein 17 n=1 Tax=Ramazzottius varieornatus TaxID=947166 RepID=A0A1D1VN30_RAMVA|nr:hypothetical protein RvY_12914 [Ramazzottius varieornatus]
MALAYYKLLDTGSDFVQKILELQNKLILEIKLENAAATKIQCAWRRYKAWTMVQYWQQCAKTIQKLWKGYEARKKLRQMKIKREHQKLIANLDKHATVIQSAWRGYSTRKNILDFCARKRYLTELAITNDRVQTAMRAHYQESERSQAEQLRSKCEAAAEKALEKMHVQLSTTVHPGVLAKNVRLEDAVKEQVRKQLRSDPTILAALAPPEHPTLYGKSAAERHQPPSKDKVRNERRPVREHVCSDHH